MRCAVGREVVHQDVVRVAEDMVAVVHDALSPDPFDPHLIAQAFVESPRIEVVLINSQGNLNKATCVQHPLRKLQHRRPDPLTPVLLAHLEVIQEGNVGEARLTFRLMGPQPGRPHGTDRQITRVRYQDEPQSLALLGETRSEVITVLEAERVPHAADVAATGAPNVPG